MVSLVGPLAMIGYELRQARKGATVVADSCAGVRLARATTQIRFYGSNGYRCYLTFPLDQPNTFLMTMVV